MGNDGLNVRIAPRRGDGDTRRFLPADRRACTFNGGLPAAVLPPAQLRTPMLARHSRPILTQNRAFGVLKGVDLGADAGRPVLIYANWSIGVKILTTVASLAKCYHCMVGLRSAIRLIYLFRYMPPARAPMTSVANRMNKAVLSGDSARMMREQ